MMAAVAVCGPVGRFAVARQTDLRRQIGRHATCLYHQLLPTEGESACPFHQPARSQPQPVKSYQQIPTPRSRFLVGTLLDVLANGGAPKIHEYSDKRHRQFGPIYRETLGSVEAVFVADGQLIQRVYQNEGKYPMHMVPEPWTLYNKKTGKQRGLFFMDGPLWNQRRRSLNKVFLRQKTVAEYADVFNSVVTDLLNRWRFIRDENKVVQDLEKELYNWSVESLGTMIFGRRLGCVDSDHRKDGMHEFVHCVQQIFRESAKMTMIPPRLAYMLKLPVWRRFVRAADKALYLAKDYVEENVAEIVAKAGSGQTVDGVLSQLLLQEDIKEDEIVRIIIDLFLAAADTTSHATQWALYLLAKNPECQERLFQDIQKVIEPGETINEKHLPQLPYVKGVIKEALRLYPVAPYLTRVLSHDLVLGGYEIPAGKLILMSLYTTGRDEKQFENPNKFMPERWIRQEQQDVVNTHACLPFGIGSRSCIGRRVAEMKMQFLIARTIQQFKLKPANKRDVDIHMRMITTPDEPITLQAEDRT
ncbi:cytochrome P450 315a1, mitochondrial-like [Centruroides sculpturatus]|uniref:cytochrome P450 315a1, mitochondrial-like n=1 Tax=Centruroides sculpturatus TaxID=218467 RepID=UPI000C6E68EA|nr:cytochrome P450 315a1, mitochondrial-like [Centruroides sculpturatus]